MIEDLIDLEISLKELDSIKDQIDLYNEKDFNKNIKLLKEIGCNRDEIKNIVISNPLITKRSYEDIYKLIDYMINIGFTYLNLLFSSYPYFLNKDKFEIEEFIEEKIKMGLDIDEIVDMIDSNPMIVDEI